MFRIGLGQDSHRFCENEDKKLIMGGVEIPGERGLEANSDGDAVIHALCAAIEQALGRTNFSTYADKLCESGVTDSAEYLKIAMEHMSEDGYAFNNVGISVEGKRPRILPVEEKMKIRLAGILGIEKSRIGINATTGEDLNAFGRGEGVQVFVIVSLMKK